MHKNFNLLSIILNWTPSYESRERKNNASPKTAAGFLEGVVRELDQQHNLIIDKQKG